MKLRFKPKIYTTWKAYRIACIFRGGLIFALFAVGQRPRKLNPRIFHNYVLVLKLFVWVRDSTCCSIHLTRWGKLCIVNLHWDMALLQYFRSVPGEHLPLPGQSLVSAKGLIFRETTVARKYNPWILSTVIQPERPPQKFCPAKNTRYTVGTLSYIVTSPKPRLLSCPLDAYRL